MPNSTHELLCSYHYDALDRLASRSPPRQPEDHCFYQKNRLVTQIKAQRQRSWLQTPGQLLAQQRRSAEGTAWALVASDTQGSVLHGLDSALQQAYAYATYGTRYPVQDPLHLPGFNRELPDPVTGHYLLGNGYRAFNPVLMRFNSPDSESPFGKGGLNAYAYCAGDPINRIDPSGRLWGPIKRLRNFFRSPAQKAAARRNEWAQELTNQIADQSVPVTRLPFSSNSEVLVHPDSPYREIVDYHLGIGVSVHPSDAAAFVYNREIEHQAVNPRYQPASYIQADLHLPSYEDAMDLATFKPVPESLDPALPIYSEIQARATAIRKAGDET